MSKGSNGSGWSNSLISRLATARGRALAVAVVLVLIAAAGVGCAPLGGASSTKLVAHTAPTATTYDATTLTLEPTQAATATPHVAPTATSGPGSRPTTPAQQPTPRPTVASSPHLDVVNGMFVQEPSGCGAQYPDYFTNGFTVKNSGGKTLTWKITLPTNLPISAYQIQFTAWGGSLSAGHSVFVRIYWVKGSEGQGAIAPAGSIAFTISSNGGQQQMYLECAPS